MINSIIKNKIMYFLALFTALVALGLTSEYEQNAYMTTAKYTSLAVFVIVYFLDVGRIRGDSLILSGFVFFLVLSILFTIINSPDVKSILVILGYVACLLIYMVSCAGKLDLSNVLNKFLKLFSIVFLLVNIPQLLNPAAYSIVKEQFTGLLGNANAFAGICGFCFVYVLSTITSGRSWRANFYSLVILVLYLIFIFLAGSRGVILSVVFAFFFMNIKSSIKLYAIIALLGAVVAYLYLGGSSFQLGFGGFAQRSLGESTGREDIFWRYIEQISERLFIGTGLSEGSGRIKSELSYLDLTLFSGIGVLGYFVFLFRTYYFALITPPRSQLGWWVVPIFSYVTFSSIFEGYAANIVSLPSIFLYITAGFIYASSRRQAKTLGFLQSKAMNG
jgi:hypothetical protein